MATSLHEAVNTARTSWLCNTTIADKRWALRELHGLYDLLLRNRDELIAVLVNESRQPRLFYEKEFAILVGDIAAFITYVDVKGGSRARNTQFGHLSIASQPWGVSLIISNSTNPLRFAIAPFAASIAARNSVVLATTKASKFFSILQREAPRHLDSFTLHIVSEEIQDVRAEGLDHLLILDDNEEKWSSQLKFPNKIWCPVTRGHNIAIIDEEPSGLQQSAKQILQSFGRYKSQSDALTAVFVHQQVFQAISKELTTAEPGTKSASSMPPLQLPTSESLKSRIYTVDLSDVVAPGADEDLHRLLEVARAAEALLLIQASSIDQIIDATRQLNNIQQIAFLGHASDKARHYVETWTRSAMLSVGSVRAAVPAVVDASTGLVDRMPITYFPVNLFSQPRLVVSGEEVPTQTSIEAIRKSYEKKIPQLKPEHPGGRVDFFVQVEYTLMTVAGVIGAVGLVGLWYGAKAMRRRFL